MPKNKLDEATKLTDDWSKVVIPLTRDMDVRNSDWDVAMPRKVYAAIENLWKERRSFLGRVAVELKGDSRRR